MEFSFSLAIFTWLQGWAEGRRKRAIRAIVNRQINQITAGLTVEDDGQGMYDVRGLTLFQMQEVAGILKMADEFGYGSPLTRILKERMDKKVWGDAEVRS